MGVETTTRKPGGWLKLGAFLLVGAVGYGAGYLFAPGSEAQASLSKSAPGPAAPTTTTTTLPNKKVNAFVTINSALPGIDGREHSLDEWKGKVIMLNFWATWCPPCQYEIPDFIGFQEQYAGKGLQIVGVGIDEMRKLKNFARTMDMNYPVLASLPTDSGPLLADWGDAEQILPYTVVIDRDGRITYIQRGGFTAATFTEFVLPLLEKRTAGN